MIGAGTQIFVVVLCVFLLSLVGTFYPYNRGAMLSACVVLYALTAGISGGGGRLCVCIGCHPLDAASSSCACCAAMYCQLHLPAQLKNDSASWLVARCRLPSCQVSLQGIIA
jgi:hypothetical protein